MKPKNDKSYPFLGVPKQNQELQPLLPTFAFFSYFSHPITTWVSKWGTSRLHSLQTKTCQNGGGFGPGPLPKKNVKRLVCDSTHPKQKTCSKPSKNHWLIYPSKPPIIWSFGGIHSNEIKKYQENFTQL